MAQQIVTENKPKKTMGLDQDAIRAGSCDKARVKGWGGDSDPVVKVTQWHAGGWGEGQEPRHP